MEPQPPREPEWTPFRRLPGEVVDPDGVTGGLWQNSRYQVILRERRVEPFGRCIHLTLRSVEGAPRHDWRDFQRIKNELVGEEAEAVELYPAESRVVDTANHYHLWIFPDYRFPFGMQERETSDGGPGIAQRPHGCEP
jgi:hypothetical protein